MTKDEIYELARQAGFDAELMKSNAERGSPSIAETYARLVAAKEREAIEKRVMTLDETMATRVNVVNNAIRARGEA